MVPIVRACGRHPPGFAFPGFTRAIRRLTLQRLGTERVMSRVRLVVAAAAAVVGVALAGCSGMPDWMTPSMPDWLSPQPAGPQMQSLRFESDPLGADVRTAQGQTCLTPCALAVPSESQAVTITKIGFIPQTVQISAGEAAGPFILGKSAAALWYPTRCRWCCKRFRRRRPSQSTDASRVSPSPEPEPRPRRCRRKAERPIPSPTRRPRSLLHRPSRHRRRRSGNPAGHRGNGRKGLAVRAAGLISPRAVRPAIGCPGRSGLHPAE